MKVLVFLTAGVRVCYRGSAVSKIPGAVRVFRLRVNMVSVLKHRRVVNT